MFKEVHKGMQHCEKISPEGKDCNKIKCSTLYIMLYRKENELLR